MPESLAVGRINSPLHLARSLYLTCYATDEKMSTKDSNGTELADGDSVSIIKDLKVKGASATLKRGTIIKNIRTTDNEEEIECRSDKIKGLVLKTCFLKKA